MVKEIHRRAFAALGAWVGNPAAGLPEEFFLFLSRFTPLVNVDLPIRDDRRRTLLTWRQDDTYGAGWHVPGGIIRYDETAADRICTTASGLKEHVPIREAIRRTAVWYGYGNPLLAQDS